jgi:hypothetical protein
MSTNDVAITTARITAFQAIAVALITGILTMMTTLLATGNLFGRHEGTAAASGPHPMSASVLDAPQILFNAQPAEMSLNECVGKASSALTRAGFTGVETARYFVRGYRGDTMGTIWCHTDARQLIFIAAGKDASSAEDTRSILVRSY